MFCQAATGKFIVRRCRNSAGKTCSQCSKKYCQYHYHEAQNACLVCGANLAGPEGATPHWDNYFYSSYTDGAWHAHDLYGPDEYDAFDDLTARSDNQDLDRLYDS